MAVGEITSSNPITRWLERRRAAREERKAERIAAREERERERDGRRAEKMRARIDAHLRADLRKDLRRTGKRLVHRLTLLEFAHFMNVPGEKKMRVSRVKFAQVAASPAALFYRVDTVRLPRGRGITSENLTDPEILNELSMAVGRQVTAHRHYERGLWFIVDRSSGLASTPAFVEYHEILGEMPKSTGSTDIPLGFGAHHTLYHADIADFPHLLVAGATGYGKSIFLHSILCTIIQRARPDHVKLVLADLKGGAELGVYVGVPHLLDQRKPEDQSPDIDELEGDEVHVQKVRKTEGFVIEPVIYSHREDIPKILYRLNYEVERRLQIFQKCRVRNLGAYNFKYRSRRMPVIVAVIDEIQNVMMDGKLKSDTESQLVDIASRSRAAGVHLVVATQRPSVDVITGLIKANFPARIAFNTASQADSRVILDKADAFGLGRPGLMIFQGEGNKKFKCQAPYLSEGLVQEIVEQTIKGVGGTIDITASVGKWDILRWAVEENQGHFTIDESYAQFRGKGITYAEVRDIYVEFSAKGNELELDGRFYRLRERDSTFVEIQPDGSFVPAVTLQEMAEWSVKHNDSKFSRRDLFDQFRDRLTNREVRKAIKTAVYEIVQIGQKFYQLQPKGNTTVWVEVDPDLGQDTGRENIGIPSDVTGFELVPYSERHLLYESDIEQTT